MTETDPLGEAARADLAVLLELREAIAVRAGALRALSVGLDAPRRDVQCSRAQRCERVIQLLDTRIRLAAELLARGRVSPARVSNESLAS